jgi:hypothetical protein
VDNVPLWLPLPSSLELEHTDFRCCGTPSLFFILSETVVKCLGKAGILTDGVWKTETGRRENNLKLGDQRCNVSLADKASMRSLGRKCTKNFKKK